MSLAVIIPTYHRPLGLKAALESVIMQTRQPDEIIIVDNSAEATARELVASYDHPGLTYVHEPRPGVAHARNAALAATDARYIAFLDDDEIASPNWLSALMKTADELRADIVFGPLSARADTGISGIRQHVLDRLYSRPGPADDMLLEKPYGCGNSLIDRARFDLGSTPFDTDLNETGGEDDAFFDDRMHDGARFAWSAKAHAVECVDPDRARWRYMLARSFAFGQGPSQTCARAPGNWGGVAFWMTVGLAQLAVFAPLALITSVFAPQKSAAFIDKSAQAVGKVFWFDGLAPRFYGQAS
ncbi:MAG: glycosyltransferase [Alphaproteobacteria bacterium]|nr:glycosyltransferase [Alphaproteobacteria bacterium]